MSAPATPSARERLAELCARVDAFFDRVAARFPGEDGVTCRSGCSDCCRRRFSVTAVEAEVVAELLAALPAPDRAAIAARAREGDACPALEPDGRCAVYAARPLICRTHGLPIRFAAEGPGSPPGLRSAEPSSAPGPRHLPIVDACPRNFGGRDLAAIPGEHVLEQATLSTVLGALDAARAAELGRSRRDRVEMEALLG